MNNSNASDALPRSQQVYRYLEETTQIVTKWIAKGESADEPVTKYASGHEARADPHLPKLSSSGQSDEDVFKVMEAICDGSVNPWTGRFVDKLYTAPLPLGVASETLLAAINANAHVMSASPMLCLAEETCVAAMTGLCGWDEDLADGLTMPGGSSSNTLALQTAINSMFPDFRERGVAAILSYGDRLGRSKKASQPLIFTSAEGHYSIDKAAIACGLGANSVVKVPCDEYGQMDARALGDLLQAAFDFKGNKSSRPGLPIFINATAGSTVMGAFDPIMGMFDAMSSVFNQVDFQRPWLHVDGSWGGPILFSDLHRNRMQGIQVCDSLTINPHKLLNVPLQCSFLLLREGEKFSANALDAPYLFHETTGEVIKPSYGVSHKATASEVRAEILENRYKRRENPAQLNFGCGRRGDALKMYLLWLSKGGDYFARLVDEGIARAQQVVQHIKADLELVEKLEVAPLPLDKYFLQVCVRPRVTQVTGNARNDREACNQATRAVHARLRQEKRFAVDFAPLGRDQGEFIRIVTHPTTPLNVFIELLHDISKGSV